jgi:hypothetical protein
MSRSFGIGAILFVVSVVLAGCTSGPSKTASRQASAAVTPGPAAKLIEPPGPVSARPALLGEASAACRGAGAADVTLCAGTVDAEVWGLPLVILNNLRNVLACLVRVNVLGDGRRAKHPGLSGTGTTVIDVARVPG